MEDYTRNKTEADKAGKDTSQGVTLYWELIKEILKQETFLLTHHMSVARLMGSKLITSGAETKKVCVKNSGDDGNDNDEDDDNDVMG